MQRVLRMLRSPSSDLFLLCHHVCCLYTCAHAHTLCTLTHVHICTHVHIHSAHVHMYTYAHTCTYTLHTYTCTHMHTRAHTHTHTSPQGLGLWAADKLAVVQSLDPESYSTMHTALTSMLDGMQVRAHCLHTTIQTALAPPCTLP